MLGVVSRLRTNPKIAIYNATVCASRIEEKHFMINLCEIEPQYADFIGIRYLPSCLVRVMALLTLSDFLLSLD